MRFKNFKVIACGLLTCLSMGMLQADNFNNLRGDVNLTNGYRADKITTRIDSFDPADTLVTTDDLKARNLQSYQAGAKGRALLCGWTARIEADYSWILSGRYHENTASVPAGLASVVSGKIHDGNMKDLIIGGGYLLNLGDWLDICADDDEYFALGPVGGWAYDQQHIKVKEASIGGVPFPVLNGLKYTTRWQGPWVGVDATFSNCEYTFYAGYEYHWADWHATWRLAGPDVAGVAFSDRRRSSNASGQVFYFDGRMHLIRMWTIGFGLKYQTWKVDRGTEVPLHGSFVDVGGTATEVDKVKRAIWQSFSATLDIGFRF